MFSHDLHYNNNFICQGRNQNFIRTEASPSPPFPSPPPPFSFLIIVLSPYLPLLSISSLLPSLSSPFS